MLRMKTRNGLRSVQNGFNQVNRAFRWLGYLLLVIMILVTFTDVIGRFFDKPMKGSLEITELIMAVLGGLAMLIATASRAHIIVDIVSSHFPKRARVALGVIGSVLGFFTWAIITYRVVISAELRLNQGSATAFLFIPQSPFEFALAFGLLLFCLSLLLQAFSPTAADDNSQEDRII
jgi:TRAP-type transport system small permease protein